MDAGYKLNEVLDFDWWQYLGTLKVLREKIKKDMLEESYRRKNTQLLFVLCKANGLREEFDEFFSFEDKINSIFDDDYKEVDKLEGKGKYEQIDGEEEWIYDYNEIQDIIKYINTANK